MPRTTHPPLHSKRVSPGALSTGIGMSQTLRYVQNAPHCPVVDSSPSATMGSILEWYSQRRHEAPKRGGAGFSVTRHTCELDTQFHDTEPLPQNSHVLFALSDSRGRLQGIHVTKSRTVRSTACAADKEKPLVNYSSSRVDSDRRSLRWPRHPLLQTGLHSSSTSECMMAWILRLWNCCSQ